MTADEQPEWTVHETELNAISELSRHACPDEREAGAAADARIPERDATVPEVE